MRTLRHASAFIRSTSGGHLRSGIRDAHAYLYSTYEEECEAQPRIAENYGAGGGPNRIGQGIEFDYCCVHAALACARTASRDHCQLQHGNRIDGLRHVGPSVLRAPRWKTCWRSSGRAALGVNCAVRRARHRSSWRVISEANGVSEHRHHARLDRLCRRSRAFSRSSFTS